MTGRLTAAVALGALLGAAGCASTSTLYAWGDYEDSLYLRERDASEAAQARAFAMVEKTIRAAEQAARRVPPGVYADYGYLLFRQGRKVEAVEAFRKEAASYPEARDFMEAVIARVEGRAAR